MAGRLLALALLLAPFAAPGAVAAQATQPAPIREFLDARHRDDLEGIVKRRQVRALVVWNRTDYFVERGQQYGMAWEAAQELERWLNARYQRTLRRIHVVLVPVARGELVELLADHRADLAIAGLTVTPERAARIDFTTPIHDGVSEIVVSRRASPLLPDRDSLAGERFFVRPSSSYVASLNALAGRFVLTGLPPVRILPADEHLEDEDILELVNAGVIERTVVDDYKARLWAGVLPEIRVEAASVRDGATLAWGVRPGAPKFRALIDEFVRSHRIGTEFGNVLAKRYYGSDRWIRRPLAAAEVTRYDAVAGLFRKYGERYGFDPLLVTAQGFQESGLDQGAVSPEGAIGIMQVMPRTGRAMQVGDIRQTEANIHAGLKYLRELVDTYFSEPGIDAYNRTLLAFAAYNAGPSNIRRMQRLARSRGLDPHRWFDHVERVTGERLGGEPVRYVANISKYYIAYRLLEEQRKAREEARGRVGVTSPDREPSIPGRQHVP